MRYSKSLPVSNNNDYYIYGGKVSSVANKYEGLYVLGTRRDNVNYSGTIAFSTGPGYDYSFSAGKDKCTTTKPNSSTEKVTCVCKIGPDTWPKECTLAFITAEYQGYGTSYGASYSTV